MRYDTRALVRARMAKGWTQRHLAKLTGLDPATICRVEAGQRQSPRTIRHVAEILNVDIGGLIVEDSGK